MAGMGISWALGAWRISFVSLEEPVDFTVIYLGTRLAVCWSKLQPVDGLKLLESSNGSKFLGPCVLKCRYSIRGHTLAKNFEGCPFSADESNLVIESNHVLEETGSDVWTPQSRIERLKNISCDFV